MVTKARMLKIKLKSLVLERKVIQRELENKKNGRPRMANTKIWWELYKHDEELKMEIRLTLIAYGYVRGLLYSRIERPRKDNRLNPKQWARVFAMVEKYGIAPFHYQRDDVTRADWNKAVAEQGFKFNAWSFELEAEEAKKAEELKKSA